MRRSPAHSRFLYLLSFLSAALFNTVGVTLFLIYWAVP